jgi:hypothetical protein
LQDLTQLVYGPDIRISFALASIPCSPFKIPNQMIPC